MAKNNFDKLDKQKKIIAVKKKGIIKNKKIKKIATVIAKNKSFGKSLANKQSWIITSALPYANGPLHVGHLLEYIQTDIIVRAKKLAGEDVIYVCASDCHGTPVEIKAQQEGIKPEQLIQKYFEEHQLDLSLFNIHFDSFYLTHSEENRKLSEWFFLELKKNGHIYQKELELTFCNICNRFLPDRFVKGECANCHAKEQYGDQCEKCGKTYRSTELINPFCVMCKKIPVKRKSLDYFFKLSSFRKKLKDWLSQNTSLQSEVVNNQLVWINKGLNDWCISREAPYFGFLIPEEKNKYFYVWLDAPIGYIASLAHYFKGDTVRALKEWNSRRILHIIGKDIEYFHFLFWPATLWGVGLKAPEEILVHGFLTVNGEKMSKSRGKYPSPGEFSQKYTSELLRFYYSLFLSRTVNDVDFSEKEFLEKINGELISTIANFVYRTLNIVNVSLNGKIGVSFNKQLEKDILALSLEAQQHYLRYEIREAVRCILNISALGNKYFQEKEPWKLVKTDFETASSVLADCVNIVKVIIALIKPVLPEYSARVETQLNVKPLAFSDAIFSLKNHSIGTPEIVFHKLENKDALQSTKPFDPFASVDLRVAKIIDAKIHPDAQKLLLLKIDIGTEQRQIVAGIRAFYQPQELVGKNVIVVANLEPVILRGQKSEGMLLAASNPERSNVVVLECPDAKIGEQIIAEGIVPQLKGKITIETFASFPLIVHNNFAIYDDKKLVSSSGKKVIAKAGDGWRIG